MEQQQKKYFGQSQESSSLYLIAGVAMTLVVHMLVVGGIFAGTLAKVKTIEETQDLVPFTPVELIKLGDPESTSLEAPNPSPEEVKKSVKVSKKPPPDLKPEPDLPNPNKVLLRKKEDKKEPPKKRADKTKPSSSDLLKQFTNDPTKPVNNNAPRGRKDGVAEGTTLNANARNQWATQVQRAVKRRWRVPRSIDPDLAKSYAGKVAVRIRVSTDGHIISYSMARKTGDPVYDASVERAVKAFMVRFGGGKLPMPDDPVTRKAVTKGGLVLTGWRYRGG